MSSKSTSTGAALANAPAVYRETGSTGIVIVGAAPIAVECGYCVRCGEPDELVRGFCMLCEAELDAEDDEPPQRPWDLEGWL